ncbi:MAG: flagellar basal body rod protein FlgB [Spirochaetales bacterium]|nr:flagellar basal body rod protein FlgB [Spirochaetales bacterium]
MFLNNSFGRNLDILNRSLSVEQLRRNVITDNMANADTPNFKRTDVSFETELKKALHYKKQAPFDAKMTDSRHIPFEVKPDYRDVKPKRNLDYLSQTDNNGNNVDIEVESMLALQNQMRYDMLTRAVSSQFNLIAKVLK